MLLCALASEPTRVFIRQELLRDVWGYPTESRTLDGHTSKLRRKLAPAVGHVALVINVWGVG